MIGQTFSRFFVRCEGYRSRIRWGRASTAAFGAVLLAATSMHLFAAPPADLDYSRTRVSEGGIYRATIVPRGDTIRVGRMHAWKLHVETSGGQAVDDATITVDGGMPQHGHGLPTKPRVTRSLGGGDYLVEGMKFNMGGWWTVTFALSATAGADSVTFNLSL
jgi:hypothetical protein